MRYRDGEEIDPSSHDPRPANGLIDECLATSRYVGRMFPFFMLVEEI
jgi:hypothetical protein